MAQNEYNGKWKRWLHMVSNGRWIVAEERDGYWFTKNTVENTGSIEIKGHNPLDLVGKGARTYANVNAAIKALRRVYDPPDGSSEARSGNAFAERRGELAARKAMLDRDIDALPGKLLCLDHEPTEPDRKPAPPPEEE
jgi:hypothetical protein